VRLTAAHAGRHVPAAELVDATAGCPACGAPGPRPSVLRLQADPDVHFLACPRCRALSASHMPSAAFLDRYYAEYYVDRDRRVTFADPERFARHLLRALAAARVRPGPRVRILDFGGGDGSLALALAGRLIGGVGGEAEVLVIDRQEPAPSPDPRVRLARAASLAEAEIAGGGREFDLVLASAVLEHVPDLRPLLAALLAAVAPGGAFYARTPAAVPLARLVPGLDLGYPAHVHDLGSGFWNRAGGLFRFRGRTAVSRPSLVATGWRDPLRTGFAHLLKLPARIEGRLAPARPDRMWNLVGGWEVVLVAAMR
jgi:SAM-dependent methyltransferase